MHVAPRVSVLLLGFLLLAQPGFDAAPYSRPNPHLSRKAAREALAEVLEISW